ncbi:MAG: hypothetical protein WD428_03770 [Gaiellaceae bacterium]
MKALLAGVVFAVVLAGCAEGGEEAGTTQAAQTHTVASTTTPSTTEDMSAVGQDPDDAEGPLDLKLIEARREADLLRLEFQMWEPWDEAVLESPSLLVPGTNRLTLFYDVDLDGRIDYRGRFIFSEGVLSLVISGSGQAFEPVPVNRLDNDVVSVVHAVDVFFVVLGEAEIESEVDLQVAMRSEFGGVADRAPDEGWIRVPFA